MRDEMKLGPLAFARFLYWTFQRSPRAAVHMLAVLPAFLLDAVRLFYRIRLSGDRRPTVAIALMEHMGDIVAAEPIARLARTRFPGSRIWWIARATYMSLPASYPDVDHVAAVSCLTEWMLLRRLGLFDVVWDLHLDGRMCPLCRVPQNKRDVRPNEQYYYDLGTLLDVQCDSAGLSRISGGPMILPSLAAVATVDGLALPPRFVAIHCMSSDKVRDWPEDKWRDLIARILAVENVAVVEVGLRPAVIAHDSARQYSLCGRLSMLETAEVIRRADLFVGIDSGPAHLANGVGTPGVILLGAFINFRTYMPYNGGYANAENAHIVRADGVVARLSVEEVLAAVLARLAAGQLAKAALRR